MTELSFKGKEFVYNHHLSVPFHPLVPHPEKGIGDVALDGNLIIQGDNLKALKALMPMYAGKVDCIFIDPPYNTGNEGWGYNDNVNAPMIKEWLNGNPIGIDDSLRHDKWCAMMWPRLRLLHELLAEDGSFWMTIDDNEVHRARAILDEIFGEAGFVASAAWQARYSVSSDAAVSNSHNYILVYSKQPETWAKLRNQLPKDAKQEGRYSNSDGDPNGPWRSIPWDAAEERDESLSYPIITPKGTEKRPPKGRHWSGTIDNWEEKVSQGLAYFGQDEDGAPAYKKYLKDAGTVVPITWWPHYNSGNTDEASKELTRFGLNVQFETPKPVRLLKKIFSIATKKSSIVLDSFAGSGTTGQAVLELNKSDGGSRKFILVEMEEYANELTADRIRKVANGYDFQGNIKKELFRQKISWTKIKNASRICDEVEKIENLHGHEYDEIEKKVIEGELVVNGKLSVPESVEGIGGEFTYCTLGDAIEMDTILTGENLPAYDQLGGLLFHMATNRPLNAGGIDQAASYLGESEDRHVWLIYKDDLDWLKSQEAALTLSFARKIVAEKTDKPHLVFAPARFVSQKLLNEENLQIEFAPLPFALYRVERD
ncbi:site-specific DNA-methyltransferase [Shimia thalassica]|uniref:site-specific DNA-methyltransferase n=1 Tax=Shimia thalassica TaxID=1715693 RepID=UPI0026E3AD85|nr:site-specific DNA-methyltransferase [Shimia thalassica]MDO6480966.1 site-specific DNA-methyltransferase [Shimia thalassica]